MRIRSIRPEFWTSLDVTKHTYFDRLLFIGLWSYVDDNGVGPDRLPLIIGELFPDDMSRDPRETLARVSDGLRNLADGGQIIRYERDGRALLFIPGWDMHQRIDRPGKIRYERPTSEDAPSRDTLATVSRQSRETPSTGEGEKGRRESRRRASAPHRPAPASPTTGPPTPPSPHGPRPNDPTSTTPAPWPRSATTGPPKPEPRAARPTGPRPTATGSATNAAAATTAPTLNAPATGRPNCGPRSLRPSTPSKPPHRRSEPDRESR